MLKSNKTRVCEVEGEEAIIEQKEDLLLQDYLLVPWSDPLHQGMLRMQVIQFY